MKVVKALLKKNDVGHYKQQKIYIQPIELCVSANFNFCQGNVIKYISRCDQKGEHLDLNKALDYLYWGCQIIEKSKDFTIFNKLLILERNVDYYNIKEFENFYTNFIEQHDDELKELLIFAIDIEAQSAKGITKKLIHDTYIKFNDISMHRFNQPLTSNIFYNLYMETQDVK